MNVHGEYTASTTNPLLRIQRANTYLKSLESVQSSLPNSESKEKVSSILDFIFESVEVGTPLATANSDNPAVVSVPKLASDKEVDAAFVPLFTADLALSQYYTDIRIPTYSEGMHTVFIPPRRFGDLWRGILMFHEFSHAKHHTEDNFRGHENSHYLEEVSVFQDEHELVRHLFKGYSSRVSSAAKNVGEVIDDGKAVNFREVVMAHDFFELFPKPQSRTEIGMAMGTIILDIIFEDIDNSAANEKKAMEQKIKWTKKLYTEFFASL